MLKRFFDILVALGVLLMMSPVMLIVALAIKLKLGSPVIFSQDRPGHGGRLFKMYKFRTMLDARDGTGALLPDNQRMTKFGHFLRATSLDEFPALWNVLKGEMSLVGPRPLLVEYLPLYSERQAKRHDVKPGITGWAQVNGRNDMSWDEKFEHDVWYVEHLSLGLDLKILFMTFFKVLKREGVSKQGHVTTDKFCGSKDVKLEDSNG